MSLIGLNTTPAERMRGATFAESFFNSAKVAENGGTPTGSPAINQGVTLDGATQYITYALAGGEFNSANLSIVLEVYPDFDTDEDATRYLFDSPVSDRYAVIKLNNANNNALQIRLGSVVIAGIAESTYSPFWVVGGKNVLVISGTTGNTNAFLNGSQILTSDASAWTPGSPTSAYIGASSGGTSLFDGRITKFQIYQSLLTEQEAIDLYQDDTYAYRDSITLDLPCDDRFDNPTLHTAEDSTLNANDATLGDGVTASLMPVKNSGRRGYLFDGVDDYISGLSTPTGSFTVSVMKRVAGVVSITQEHDLTTWTTLLSSGGFSGDLLSLRVHPSVLTDTQLLDEQFNLNERLNVYGLPSGFISRSISEGALVMYQDYRSGFFHDWSENDNSGVPDPAVVWNTRSLSFIAAGALVTVSDSPELQLTEGSVVVLADFRTVTGTQYLLSKGDASGINFNFYLTSAPARLTFFDGLNVRDLAHDLNGDDYVAVNFADGEACEGFANALSLGVFSGVSAVSVDNADVIVGSTYLGGSRFLSPYEAVLVFNRKLTETEHRRAYSELYSDAWATEVFSRPTIDVADYIEPADQTNQLSLDMQKVAGIVPDLSAYGREVSAATGGMSHHTQLGSAMAFDGIANYLDCGTYFQALTDLTVSMWIRPSDVTTRAFIFNYYSSLSDAWGVDILSGNIRILDDIDNAGLARYSTSVTADQWYHVVAVMDSLENKFYLNGELVGSGGSSLDDWSSFAGTMYVGSRDTANYFNGDICQAQIFSEAKSATWIAEQYELGAAAIQGKTDAAAQESIAAEAVVSSYLSNTPFIITNGSWTVTNDTIGGKLCKAIKCITSARRIYMSAAGFEGSPTENAFGSWEFWVKKVEDAGTLSVQVINAVGGAGPGSNNNYNFLFDTDETVSFRRRGVDLITPATVYNLNQWYKVNITRDLAGVFKLYMDDILVGTSAADLTYVVSYAITLEMGADDLFAYSDLVGDHSLIKQSGVTAP